MMKLLVIAALAGVVSAWLPAKSLTARPTTQLQEGFGLDSTISQVVNSYDAQPDFLKGEAEYKQWINKVEGPQLVNRKVRLS
jgi:hypothetical protein